MNQIMQGQPMTIFGDGSQTRAFSYIDDVAPHIARSVHVPDACGHVINIGADKPYTVNALADIVGRAFSVKPEIRRLPVRNEVHHAYADHAKARALLGATPTVDLENGVHRMASFGPGKPESGKVNHFSIFEILEKLPPSWLNLMEPRTRVGISGSG